MKKSDSFKQIIISSVVVLTFVIGAFIVKKYFLDEENDFGTIEVKDKYGYNEFQLSNVTNEVIIQRYFIDFKEKMLTSSEDAYKLLGSKTKDVYENYYDFKNYIDNNIEELKSSYIVKYNIQKNGSTTNYIIVDQYNNQYTYSSKAVLVYSVNLELYDENSSIFE